MKNRKLAVVTTLLPPEQESPQKMLERLVKQKVEELLAGREDLELRPFFDNQRVSDAIRRLQTMPERRFWVNYFSRWGCVHCHRKNSTHCACGMCSSCYQRIGGRRKTILAEDMRTRTRERFSGDLESIAKKALAGAIKSLPPAEGR